MKYNKYIKFKKDKNLDDIVEINLDVFDEFYKEGFLSLDKSNMLIVETANERIARAKKQKKKELQFCQYLFDKIEKVWWSNFKNNNQ